MINRKRGKFFSHFSDDEKKVLILNNKRFIETHMFDWGKEESEIVKLLNEEAAKFGLSNVWADFGDQDTKEILFVYGTITSDIIGTINKLISIEKERKNIVMLQKSLKVLQNILDLENIELFPTYSNRWGNKAVVLDRYKMEQDVSKKIIENRFKIVKKNSEDIERIKKVKNFELQTLYGSIENLEVNLLLESFLVENFIKLEKLSTYMQEKIELIERKIKEQYSSILSTENILKTLKEKKDIYINENGHMFSLL
jgi:hypothetical protein